MKLELDLSHIGTRIDDLIFEEEVPKPKKQVLETENRTSRKLGSVIIPKDGQPSGTKRLMARGRFPNGVCFVVVKFHELFLLGATLPNNIAWNTPNQYSAIEIETFLRQLEGWTSP